MQNSRYLRLDNGREQSDYLIARLNGALTA